jgi:DinB superfamily
MRSLTAILNGLPKLSAACANAALAAPSLSQWSVGQHLDHVIKVHDGILAYFEDPPVGDTTEQGISMIGRVVMFTGHIPRGRGKSPERFLPVAIDVAAIQKNLASVASRFEHLSPRLAKLTNPQLRFPHPVFGGLTRLQWLRFAEIHQNHHLAIIADIVRVSVSTAPK